MEDRKRFSESIRSNFQLPALEGILLQARAALQNEVCIQWKGKTAEELTDSVNFFGEIVIDNLMKLISLTWTFPILSQHSISSSKCCDSKIVALNQRFERRTFADPFEVYRAVRIVNPSPYMTFRQEAVSWLLQVLKVASSPEILTRVKKGTITNQPLAGTVRRGKMPKEDYMLQNQH